MRKRKPSRARSILRLPFAQKPEAGLSMIELVIVVGLMFTLMAFMISQVMEGEADAKVRQTYLAMSSVESVMVRYKLDATRYPKTEEGLAALIARPGSARVWRGPYTKPDRILDAWGEPMKLESDGREYVIKSAGPDATWDTDDDLQHPESVDDGQVSH